MAQYVEVNGEIIEFPDGMSDADIERALASQNVPAEQPGVLSRFGSGVADTTIRGLPAMVKAMTPNLPPMSSEAVEAQRQRVREGGLFGAMREAAEQIPGGKVITGILGNSAQQLSNARDLYRQGDPTGAIGRVAAAVPIVGPLADQVTDTAITEGDHARAAGQLTGILGSALLPKAGGLLKKPAAKAQGLLRESAAKDVAEAFHPTAGRMAQNTAEVTPRFIEEIRKIGVPGTRKGLAEMTASQADDAWQGIREAWDAVPPDTLIETKPIISAMRAARDAKKVRSPKVTTDVPVTSPIVGPRGESITTMQPQTTGGNLVAVTRAGDQFSAVTNDAIRRIKEVAPEGKITAEALNRIRAEHDAVFRDAGGYRRLPGSISDSSTAGASKVAADATRGEINSNLPGVGAANANYHYWKQVDDIVQATAIRTLGKHSLGRKVSAGIGALIGTAVGHPVAGAMAGAEAGTVFASPWWKLNKAVNKTRAAGLLNAAPAVGLLGPYSLAGQGVAVGPPDPRVGLLRDGR